MKTISLAPFSQRNINYQGKMLQIHTSLFLRTVCFVSELDSRSGNDTWLSVSTFILETKKQPTECEASVKPTTMIHVTFSLSSVQKKKRQNAKSVQKTKRFGLTVVHWKHKISGVFIRVFFCFRVQKAGPHSSVIMQVEIQKNYLQRIFINI